MLNAHLRAASKFGKVIIAIFSATERIRPFVVENNLSSTLLSLSVELLKKGKFLTNNMF